MRLGGLSKGSILPDNGLEGHTWPVASLIGGRVCGTRMVRSELLRATLRVTPSPDVVCCRRRQKMGSDSSC
jgi:hypothetical protein